eukprot:scaffold1356_cov123-Cylindrotheca_fusiformis.AAC.3
MVAGTDCEGCGQSRKTCGELNYVLGTNLVVTSHTDDDRKLQQADVMEHFNRPAGQFSLSCLGRHPFLKMRTATNNLIPLSINLNSAGRLRMVEALVYRLFSSFLGKLIIGGIAIIGALRYSTGLYFWRQAELLERPRYDVLRKLSNGIELRHYDPYLIAETVVDGEGFREPTSQGFKACAGYIFGRNKARTGGKAEKMAMTAPVRVESQIGEGQKMAMTAPVRVAGRTNKQSKVSFVIGSQYSLKTVPKPMDKNVRLRKVPSHTLAVRTFSGPPPTDDRVQRERNVLEQTLSEVNILPKGDETLVYGYHDPFITPNVLRRNEVAVVVDGSV